MGVVIILNVNILRKLVNYNFVNNLYKNTKKTKQVASN